MFRYSVAGLFLLVFLSSGHAQQSQPQTPREQALTQKLIAEINAGLVCSGNVIALQTALKKTQDELVALKKAPAKSEPPEASKSPALPKTTTTTEKP